MTDKERIVRDHIKELKAAKEAAERAKDVILAHGNKQVCPELEQALLPVKLRDIGCGEYQMMYMKSERPMYFGTMFVKRVNIDTERTASRLDRKIIELNQNIDELEKAMLGMAKVDEQVQGLVSQLNQLVENVPEYIRHAYGYPRRWRP